MNNNFNMFLGHMNTQMTNSMSTQDKINMIQHMSMMKQMKQMQYLQQIHQLRKIKQIQEMKNIGNNNNINMENLKYLKVIDNFLTPNECTFLINFSEKSGLKDIDRGIAKYQRAEFDDINLAKMLENRLTNLGLMPQFWNGQRVVGLNTHFRFSKYLPGGEFQIHKDGINCDQNGNRSVMTLNIFLNKDFKGGETDFYHEDKKTLRQSVVPEIGRASLFESQQYHCGNKVDGIKYLLRTDVMVSL